MANILLIETATAVCSTAISQDRKILICKEAAEKNSHSAVLSVLIEQMVVESGLSYEQLDAVAVSSGPGSYTGLRIGVSTAKGLCYALNKPLISIGTLESMAMGMLEKQPNYSGLLCPMIDARRMEVYAAIYDNQMNAKKEVGADIIEEGSYAEYLAAEKVLFFGDGASKTMSMFENEPKAVFDLDFVPSSIYMSSLAEEKYQKKAFEDVAYFEPFYLKDFVAGKPSVKGLYS